MKGVGTSSKKKLMIRKAVGHALKKNNAAKSTKETPGKAKPSAKAGLLGAKKEEHKRATLYLGHLPHGFHEDQLRSYFGQFGVVTGVNLPRSRKTGRPKGHAFVQFLNKKVAEVAVETMDNYLMLNRSLKCHLLTARQARAVRFPRFKVPVTQETCGKAIARKKFVEKKNAEQPTVRHDLMLKKMDKKLKATQNMLTDVGIPSLEVDFLPLETFAV